MPKERLAAAHPVDRTRGLGEHEIQQIKAFFAQCETTVQHSLSASMPSDQQLALTAACGWFMRVTAS